jgi:hypothetical protein
MPATRIRPPVTPHRAKPSDGFESSCALHEDPNRSDEIALRPYFSSSVSGWMSIFAPVSFAARRAFWPSLPIASDS